MENKLTEERQVTSSSPPPPIYEKKGGEEIFVSFMSTFSDILYKIWSDSNSRKTTPSVVSEQKRTYTTASTSWRAEKYPTDGSWAEGRYPLVFVKSTFRFALSSTRRVVLVRSIFLYASYIVDPFRVTSCWGISPGLESDYSREILPLIQG